MTGTTQTLTVARVVDFGAYLDGAPGLGDILLPARYITTPLHPGDTVDVFIYLDSEDRPVATTERPLARVGEFAWLRVKEVNNVGAFLDWGLAKDLMVPFREQKSRMVAGHSYPVYVYLDHNSGRIVATAKLEKYLGNVFPAYRHGQQVDGMVYSQSPLGASVVVNNAHHGIIYADSLTEPLSLGQQIKAYIKHVRPDGKLDLTLTPPLSERITPLEERILAALRQAGGTLPLGDKSDPEAISQTLGCSKKDFKRAVGALYRKHLVTPGPSQTTLL